MNNLSDRFQNSSFKYVHTAPVLQTQGCSGWTAECLMCMQLLGRRAIGGNQEFSIAG